MTKTRKLNLEELRTFINEAMNEDTTDGELASDEHQATIDSEEAEDTLSESVQLLRWKKLAGLIKD